MNITTANLGWAILAVLLAGSVLGEVWGWFASQYEMTRHGITRRWYGIRAHVCLRSHADRDEPNVFRVLAWSDESTAVPWLLAVLWHGTSWSESGEEEPEPFWAPVTTFAPYTVRRFRPQLLHYGRVPVVWLTRYLPLRQPSGYLGGDPDAA